MRASSLLSESWLFNYSLHIREFPKVDCDPVGRVGTRFCPGALNRYHVLELGRGQHGHGLHGPECTHGNRRRCRRHTAVPGVVCTLDEMVIVKALESVKNSSQF